MPRYEWRGATPFRDGRNGREIERGEVAELDAHVAAPHPEFTRVEAGSDEGGSDDTPPIDPTDHTVAELRDALSEEQFDTEALAAIEAAERAGDGRTTALDAIDSARE